MLAQVERYSHHYQQAVLNLIRTKPYVHQHLDWRPINEWLRDEGEFIFLSFSPRQELRGVLAFSRPLDGLTWLRLIGVSDAAALDSLGEILQAAQHRLHEHHVRRIIVLEMQSWLPRILSDMGFRRVDHLVHMRRPARRLQYPLTVKIQRAHYRHIPDVIPIDHAAFLLPWRMLEADFRAAMSYTSHFTMAMVDKNPVGYQLSTRYSDGVHLARLAVVPEMTGQGIGTQLVAELIQKYPRQAITVNTQASNEGALRLYERLEFEYESLTTPVWELILPPA